VLNPRAGIPHAPRGCVHERGVTSADKGANGPRESGLRAVLRWARNGERVKERRTRGAAADAGLGPGFTLSPLAARLPEPTMIIREKARNLQRRITGLAWLVAALGVLAAGAGILTGWGHSHRRFISLRGDIVQIQGGGLYGHESVSMASQAIGQDLVTLLIAVPLLLVAMRTVSAGSVRGLLLRTGLLAYFAYTYLLMAFGGAYNELFLVYVALFSASSLGFVLSIVSIDPDWLRGQFGTRFAPRAVGWSLVGFGALLALLWLGRIVPALLTGKTPPGLDSDTTLFVQAGDLGIIIPAAVLAGILLMRGRAIGYLLAAVMLVNASTFGLALLAMAASMTAAGVVVAPIEVVFFSALAVVFLVSTAHTLLSIRAQSAATPARGLGGLTLRRKTDM
jgi:hypothetical protein